MAARIAIVTFLALALSAQEDISSRDVLNAVSTQLERQFDDYLRSPQDYRAQVERSARAFPEGDLFPYIYPGLAYVNLGLQLPEKKEHAAAQVRSLIDLVIPNVASRVWAGGPLLSLPDYRKHATYLGQLNLLLGAYRLISSDQRYLPLQRHLSDVLYQGLVANRGGPLASYPEYTWPFDTIPVLLSLALDGRHSRTMSAHHLGWIRTEGSNPWGLPYSQISGDRLRQPRGCDLSFRLCLLPHMDAQASGELYSRYASRFWIDHGIVSGFAEFAGGRGQADIDSGPMILGIGMSATGMGVGAAIAAKDQTRLVRLCQGLRNMEVIRPMLAKTRIGGIEIDERHFTGFLMGDAMLFYSVTWRKWPLR
jgi:hypothetical protein